MLHTQFTARYWRWFAACALLALLAPWSLVHAGRAIHERRPADPQGVVEIENVSGLIEINGWDRPEVEVTGTAGDKVERVDVSGTENRTSIHVLARTGGWESNSEVHLVVNVPRKSSVSATLVSADLKIAGVQGDVKLQSVSGSVSGEVGGDVRTNTVSGDVRLTARSAKSIEVKTISGDIFLTGGGGEVEITTVSGDAKIELASLARGRFKSISGDFSVSLSLISDGQVEGESVSGDVRLEFPDAPTANFDVQSFSGDIDNCFGPKPLQSHYGPGSRLVFKNGEGNARVRVATKSGDVQLCVKDGRRTHVASASVARLALSRLVVPYVY